MSQKKYKMAGFQVLAMSSKPMSLPEILDALGSGYSERSVRRWLSKWVDEGLVTKTGRGRATRYSVTKFQAENFTDPSKRALAYIAKPLYERKPSSYNEKWLREYNPNKTKLLPIPIRKRLYEIGNRSQNHDPAGTYAQHIYNRLLIDLSYNSSRLEGNTYSLIETQRLVLNGQKANDKLEPETIMILNHKEAIRYLVDHARRIEISQETICSIHYLLSSGLIDSKSEGSVREYGVRISGSAYIPLEQPMLLEKYLALIAKKGAQIQDPFEQSLFLLIHISYLQAFVDVNKRTARICANIPLVKNNLVPCSFNDVDKDEYLSAMLAVYELNAIEPLIDLFVRSYTLTCKMYDTTVEALGFDEIHVRYRRERRAIIRYIIENLIVSAEMNAYIQQQAERQVPEKDLLAFIDDVHEDLKLINPIRIAGLGVTNEQLEAWLKIAR